MIVFLIKRLINAAMVMLVVALMAFMIFRFVGDPIQLMVNEQTTQAEKDALRDSLGLNDPFFEQFARFVGHAVQGDFGISYRNQQEVMSLIAERFPATIELVLMATIISLVVGVPLGVLTAIRRGSWYSEGLQFLSIIGVSLPSFVIGILLDSYLLRHTQLVARLWEG
jgi:peptide/nickel transport system permease protein